MSFRSLCIAVTGSFVLSFPVAASADTFRNGEAQIDATIVPAPPDIRLNIGTCVYNPGPPAIGELAIVPNTTPLRLVNATVVFTFYNDHDPVRVDQLKLFGKSGPASPGDSVQASDLIFPLATVPLPTGIKHATCRLQEANFVGGSFYKYHGPPDVGAPVKPLPIKLGVTPGSPASALLGIPVSSSAGDSDASDSTTAAAAPPPTSHGGHPHAARTIGKRPATAAAIAVAIQKAWSSKTPDGLVYLHVRVVLTSTSPATASPGQFQADVSLPNGATQSIAALGTAAPNVLRGGYLKYTGDASELQPSILPADDFGAIGKVTISPQSPVTTVLTFATTVTTGTIGVQKVTFSSGI